MNILLDITDYSNAVFKAFLCNGGGVELLMPWLRQTSDVNNHNNSSFLNQVTINPVRIQDVTDVTLKTKICLLTHKRTFTANRCKC
jgi:hypothetical protein